VNYLLDTDACIALIDGNPPPVRPRLEQALKDGANVAVSAVVAFELWYGAAKSARRQANRQRLETFSLPWPVRPDWSRRTIGLPLPGRHRLGMALHVPTECRTLAVHPSR
jgi:predicted nucleic acid-binding protein